VHAKDKGPGRTALHYAAEQDHAEVAQLLLAHGADVNASDVLSRTPLYWATIRATKENIRMDVIDVLRQQGGR